MSSDLIYKNQKFRAAKPGIRLASSTDLIRKENGQDFSQPLCLFHFCIEIAVSGFSVSIFVAYDIDCFLFVSKDDESDN